MDIAPSAAAKSPAYSDWDRNELEIRGFLIASSRVMKGWFDAHYSAARREMDRIIRSAKDPDWYDVGMIYDIFVEMSGVDPHSYYWQLSSATVKDTCGLYEIYLERAADAVLKTVGFRLKKLDTENSWNWPECRAFYGAYFSIEVRPPPVDHIIWMRNKMAHLRDELRTKEGATEFDRRLEDLAISGSETAQERQFGLSADPPAWSDGVRLSGLETYRILNIVRSHVNLVDNLLSAFAKGTTSTSYFDALKAASPVAVPNLDIRRLLRRA